VYYGSYAGLSVPTGVLTNVAGGEITVSGGLGFLNADVHNGGLIRLESDARIGHNGGSNQNLNEGFIQVLNNSALTWNALNPVNPPEGIISGVGTLTVPSSSLQNLGVLDLVDVNSETGGPTAPSVVGVQRQASALLVTFGGASMDEATVTNPANYEVKAPGPD